MPLVYTYTLPPHGHPSERQEPLCSAARGWDQYEEEKYEPRAPSIISRAGRWASGGHVSFPSWLAARGSWSDWTGSNARMRRLQNDPC
jgi:hypothetical protein